MLQSLAYAPVEDRPNKHDRIDLILLIVWPFCLLLGMGGMYFQMHMPTFPAQSKWVFAMAIYAMACYFVAIAVTVVVRITAPAKVRLLTTALNIVLLPHIPFGTALGIYGLWKVDKKPSLTNHGTM